MCGFAGAFSLNDGPLKSSTSTWVANSKSRLSHRGPDGHGYAHGETFSVCHFRLAIVDLSSEADQPIERNGRILIYNGEIYNFKELGHKYFPSKPYVSDTVLLFDLLLNFGKEIVHELRGMFSFVFYDIDTRYLLAGRDHFGQKPLYYSKKANELVFSSIASHLGELVGFELSSEGLEQYKVLQTTFGGTTMFKNIYEIPPGHLIEFQFDQFRLEKYWRYPEPLETLTMDWEEKASDLLVNAVNRCLLSDVPVTSVLSGGLDSALVSGIAAKLGKISELYHGRFEGYPNFDESNFAKIQSSYLGIPLRIEELHSEQFDQDFVKTLHALDLPLAGPGSVNQYRVAAKIAKRYKVSLGGQGGDEFFHGYARYYVFDHQDKPLSILKGYESLIARGSIVGTNLERYFNVIRRTADSEFIQKDKLHHRVFEQLEDYLKQVFPNFAEYSMEDLGPRFDQAVILPSLLHIEDSVTMIHGLEGRLPLLDVDLIAWISGVGAREVRKFGPKGLLKKLARPFVVPEILSRSDKMGFPIPLSDWIEEGLLPEFSALAGLFQNDGIAMRQTWGSVCESEFFRRTKNSER
jgi:asparagine synthase (glutamine-hydrolysing)